MKRAIPTGMCLLGLVSLLAAGAAGQSLGDYARQQRAQKPATPAAGAKVFTNENLPKTETISEVGQPTPTVASSEPAAPEAEAAAAPPAEKPAPEEQAKQEGEWRGKFAEQKKAIEQAQRELDTLVRESELRQFQDRADTNAQLHQADQLRAAEQSNQAAIADKQQALDSAKRTLETMKDELRKAGLPSSWAE